MPQQLKRTAILIAIIALAALGQQPHTLAQDAVTPTPDAQLTSGTKTPRAPFTLIMFIDTTTKEAADLDTVNLTAAKVIASLEQDDQLQLNVAGQDITTVSRDYTQTLALLRSNTSKTVDALFQAKLVEAARKDAVVGNALLVIFTNADGFNVSLIQSEAPTFLVQTKNINGLYVDQKVRGFINVQKATWVKLEDPKNSEDIIRFISEIRRQGAPSPSSQPTSTMATATTTAAPLVTSTPDIASESTKTPAPTRAPQKSLTPIVNSASSSDTTLNPIAASTPITKESPMPPPFGLVIVLVLVLVTAGLLAFFLLRSRAHTSGGAYILINRRRVDVSKLKSIGPELWPDVRDPTIVASHACFTPGTANAWVLSIDKGKYMFVNGNPSRKNRLSSGAVVAFGAQKTAAFTFIDPRHHSTSSESTERVNI